MEKGTVIFYGMPAYGHINSNLYFVGCLRQEGFRVIYYATDLFQRAIEANGCEYRPYPFDQSALDLSDGSKLIKLYHLILTYTQNMLPVLLKEAEKEKTQAVIFDSLALWGRVVARLISVPSYAFYSIAAIDRLGSRSFMAYAAGFSADFFRYLGELPAALRVAGQLRRKYRITHLGFLSVLMNQGDYNLMGYSEEFQPGGSKFGPEYLFLGQLSHLREATEMNDFICPDKPLIYISLGTVFNQDKQLLEEVVRQLGEASACQVVMAFDWMQGSGKDKKADKDNMDESEWEFPDNFIVRPFVNQSAVLSRASLFITAGGMNSIHEALHYRVPCLFCPQQGEQLLNAKQFEQLGFGIILRDLKNLRREAVRAAGLRDSWDEALRQKVTAVHMEKALELFRKLGAPDEEKK